MAGKRDAVRQHLSDLIEPLPPGTALPSERRLCADLAVSRPTVRAAVDDLVRDGLLVRRHGAGMFTARPKIAQELTAAGRVDGVWTSRTLSIARASAGARAGRRLRITPAAPVLRISRLRLADGAPIAIDRLCVPAGLVPGLTGEDLERSSFYQLLRTRYQIEVATAEQSVEATVTDEEESALLKVPVCSPALLFERTTRDGAGQVVEFTRSLYRGDRYRLLASLRLSPLSADHGPDQWLTTAPALV
jgi:GntR family transcriptional regulator